MTGGQVPVEEGLFTWPSDDPRLVGSKCGDCGVVMFPRQRSCARCNSESVSDLELSNRGTLWTWTTQGFPPKNPPYIGPNDPETFEPYAVGYVELPGQVRVEGRLTESDPDALRIGMEMELTIIPFATDDEGNEIVTFAFRPLEEGTR